MYIRKKLFKSWPWLFYVGDRFYSRDHKYRRIKSSVMLCHGNKILNKKILLFKRSMNTQENSANVISLFPSRMNVM